MTISFVPCRASMSLTDIVAVQLRVFRTEDLGISISQSIEDLSAMFHRHAGWRLVFQVEIGLTMMTLITMQTGCGQTMKCRMRKECHKKNQDVSFACDCDCLMNAYLSELAAIACMFRRCRRLRALISFGSVLLMVNVVFACGIHPTLSFRQPNLLIRRRTCQSHVT